jgi:phage-related protein
MVHGSPKWTVEFYCRIRGDSPPLEYIRDLEKNERARIGRYINLLEQTGVKLGMPYAEHLEGPIWQLRPGQHRLPYFAHTGRRFFILHAFLKTTRATPRRHIDLAFQRMQDVIDRGL